jgi:hypothetical protein
MSNSLSIQAGASVGGSVASPQTSTPTRAPATPPAKPVQLYVNPSYQFDPTVGLVVIEFHNDQGTLSNSIPSQRQLAAYRTHQQTPPGEQAPTAPQVPNGKTASG